MTLAEIGMKAFPKPRKKAAGVPQAKRSKYGAVKAVVHGRTFHSKREAARYQELLALGELDEIQNLELQPRFPLSVNGERIGAYVADFRYDQRLKRFGTDNDCAWFDIVEDVKGWRTLPLARWKMKHFTAQYGIAVQEIR